MYRDVEKTEIFRERVAFIMKNLIIGLLCIVFCGVIMVGCNRNTPPEVEKNDDTEQIEPQKEDTIENDREEPEQPMIPQPEVEESIVDPSNKVAYRYFLIRTDGGGFASPSATMCKSVEDVEEYKELIDTGYNIGDESNQWSFTSFTNKYTDEFFTENTVLFILLDESNSNVEHKISAVGMEDSDLIVDIVRQNTEEESSNSAQWNIAVELPKKVSEAENFIINLL